MSKDYPSQYGNSPQYRNPDGTVPLPSPSDIPKTNWNTQWVSLGWTTLFTVGDGSSLPYPPGVMYGATWSSTTFDLHPELRSAQAGPKDGTPIWNISSRMYVQLRINSAGAGVQSNLSALAGMQVNAQDLVSAVFNYSGSSRPGEGVTGGGGTIGGTITNVSNLFAPSSINQQFVALAGFAPPGTTLGFGEGYPVRYWRLALGFTFFVEEGLPLPDPPTDPPSVMLQATVY